MRRLTRAVQRHKTKRDGYSRKIQLFSFLFLHKLVKCPETFCRDYTITRGSSDSEPGVPFVRFQVSVEAAPRTDCRAHTWASRARSQITRKCANCFFLPSTRVRRFRDARFLLPPPPLLSLSVPPFFLMFALSFNSLRLLYFCAFPFVFLFWQEQRVLPPPTAGSPPAGASAGPGGATCLQSRDA